MTRRRSAPLSPLIFCLLSAPVALTTGCPGDPEPSVDAGDGDGDGDGDRDGDGDGDGDTDGGPIGDGDGDGDGDTDGGPIGDGDGDGDTDGGPVGDGDGDGDTDGGPIGDGDGGMDGGPIGDGDGDLDGGPIGDGDGDGDGDPDLTVCDVVELVFEPRCVVCHDGYYKFDLREAAAITGLVNQPSYEYPGNTLVVPGSLEQSFLWRKVAEDLTGEGLGDTMPTGSMLAPGELEIIEQWILGGANTTCVQEEEAAYVPLSPEAHLNRVATALKAERPTAAEIAQVQADPAALEDLIDDYMMTPAFGETVRDLHNDALLVRTTKLFQLLFPAIGSVSALVQADPTYADANRLNREAMEAPLRTAELIVVTDRPYTEIVTGDYTVGTAATAAIWGDGSVATTTWYGSFPTTDATGAAYSHSEDPYGVGAGADFDLYTWADGRGTAGVITDNAFMSRWQSAGANYHRGRANAVTKAFLCYDYLSNPVDVSSEGGIDLSDPDAVANAVSDPSTSCWGCHATLDPLASYLAPFRPVWFSGNVGTDGYPFSMHSDLFAYDGALSMYSTTGRAPGYFVATADDPNPTPEDISGDGRIDATDLGQHLAADPRFVSCTVKRFHSYFTQKELHDIDADTLTELEDVFVQSGYSAKQLIKAIMLSEAFAASHTETEVGAEDFNGILRVRPSQAARLYERAVGTGIRFPTDFPLNLLDDAAYPSEIPLPYGEVDYFRDDFVGFRELGGGLDSFNVTRPVRTFTGGTAAAYRWIGNFGGFYAVALEASVTQPNRTLLTAADFQTATAEADIRALLVELHLKLYGLVVDEADGTVDDAYDLWSALFALHGDPSRAWMHTLSAMFQDVRFATY